METCTEIRIDFYAFVPSDLMLGLNGLRFEFKFGFGHFEVGQWFLTRLESLLY